MTLEEILAAVQDEQSPYALAKLASVARGKEVKPQQVYSYVRQGFIKATTNDLGHWSVSRDEAEKYINKQWAKRA